MLFQEIGFECTPEQLGKGVSSPRTIARYEMHLAVDCIIVTLQEIKDNGAMQVGMMTDHGHRAGQDHFIIVLVWSGRDINDSRTLKFFCPTIDLAVTLLNRQPTVSRMYGVDFFEEEKSSSKH